MDDDDSDSQAKKSLCFKICCFICVIFVCGGLLMLIPQIILTVRSCEDLCGE